MKTGFITGGTGFLGLNLIQQLKAENWHITALHLPGENTKFLDRFDVDKVEGDILDPASLKRAIPDQPDAIFHLAGDISMWKKNDERQFNINVVGTTNMCREAINKKAVRFIHTSSSSAYGYHNHKLTEKTPSNALGCGMSYNRTKYLAEQEVQKAVQEGLFAVILNPCNIIGPYDPGNWSQLIKNVCSGKLPGYPPGVGTFSHAKDIARAHISAVENGEKGENYLLGGTRASFRDVISDILKVTGAGLPLKEISKTRLKLILYTSLAASFITRQEPLMTYPKYLRLVGHLTCDDTKARRALGFSTTTILEMVTDCHLWLKQEKLI